jgi:hypothetical protein
MKSTIKTWVASAALITAATSFAQTPAPTTRAEVRAQLIQLEKSGYQPAARDPYYPAKIQAAEARVAHSDGVAQASTSDMGGTMGGATQHGSPSVSVAAKSLYSGR